jgi:hypothetical protein
MRARRRSATAQGAAYLARALRNDPGNREATQRLWSLLAHRTHLLPMAPSIRLEGNLVHYEYSPDGKRLLVHDLKDGVRFFDTASARSDGPPFRPPGCRACARCSPRAARTRPR